MAKLIDGSALLREMRKEQRECEADGAQYGGEAILYAEALDDACEIIKRAPKVDAVAMAEHEAIVYKLECLLCHATGNKYSKAGYSLEDMCRMVTDYIEECCEEAVAEEIVRCKDCKYWENGKDYEPYCNHFGNMMTDTQADDFCSYGERKSNG